MRWTQKDSDTVLARYPHESTADIARDVGRTPTAVYQHALRHGVYKSAEHKRRLQQRCARRLQESGEAFRFQRGHETWNKGTHYDNGATATQFRRGHMPANWKPVGTERVTKDGIRERKISDTRRKSDWRAVHILLWEQHNGPLSDGCFIVFANRDQSDIRLDNLVCVDRAENMRRNTIQRYPAELISAIRQVDWLDRKIREHSHE